MTVKNKRGVLYWLQLFGFIKRQKSIKEKMCEAACDLKERYKQEAREATKTLRSTYEKQKQVA